MDAAAASWYPRRTSHWTDWDVAALVDAKGASRVSVVIPARNEAPTIGGIVAGIRHELMDRHPLVDELVVIDSDSTDSTAGIAADNGATVHAARSIRPDLGGYAGKGEAMWKSLFVTTGQTIAFIDADLTGWGPTSSPACSARCSPTPLCGWSKASTTGFWRTGRPGTHLRADGSPSWSPAHC